MRVALRNWANIGCDFLIYSVSSVFESMYLGDVCRPSNKAQEFLPEIIERDAGRYNQMIGSSFPILLYHTFSENFSMICVRVPVQLEQRAYSSSSSRSVQNYFIMINCAAQIKKIVSN